MAVLFWPTGEPRSRMNSKGGLVQYCIVKCGADAYRWGASKGQWSGIVYQTLQDAKDACELDYFRAIQRAALGLRADGREVY